MTTEDLPRLRAKRGTLKGSITRIEQFVVDVKNLETASLDMLQARKDKLIGAFKDYEEVNIDILSLDKNDCEKVELVENKYFDVLAKINTTLKLIKSKEVDNMQNISTAKLPNIDIPLFDGKDFTKFKPFIDLFEAVIDDSNSLSNVQKLFYLRKYLTHEALSVIINLPLVNESYTKALELLKKRFDNKARLVTNHINILLDLPCMQKGTATLIRTFISDVQQQLYALSNLGQPIESWDMLLISILSRKLDAYTNRSYHLDKVDTDKMPTMSDFINYLEKRAIALEDSSFNKSTYYDSGYKSNYKSLNSKVSNHASHNETKDLCSFCEKHSHPMFMCPQFKLAPVQGRKKFIEESKRCAVCLNFHNGKCKFNFKCKSCKKAHNSLLHEEDNPRQQVSNYSNTYKGENVLLPTVQVKLRDRYGCEVCVKALLDSGSQGSFIKHSLVNKLKLDTHTNKTTTIIGIGNKRSQINKTVNVSICSSTHALKFDVICYVVETITSQLPQQYIDLTNLEMPENIKLSDIGFNIPSDISILLGADLYFKTLLDGCIKLKNGLVLQNTLFGYVVGGSVKYNNDNNNKNQLVSNVVKCEPQNRLENIMENFWLSEKLPEEPLKTLKTTSEFEKAEQSFVNSVSLENNRFSVDLPLANPVQEVEIGDSFSAALQRFISLEKKFKTNDEYYEKYKMFINEYLQLGHAKIVDINSYDVFNSAIYFLSHHAVLNEASKTTKLRVVFNGSMKSKLGISLNDILLNGPIIQNELFDILILFRTYLFTLISDMKMMFRQILINEQHRPLQNILWRDNPSNPIHCLQLQTVTYGLKSSTFLSARCLLELAIQFQSQFPLAAQIILNNTYVDDVLCGADDVETLKEVKKQLIDLLKLGGFTLHKWCSNHQDLLNDVPTNLKHFEQYDLNKDHIIKTLGLKYDIVPDNFKFICPPINEVELSTKRNILSFIGKIFDPLGLIAPVVMVFKIFMQKLYSLQIGWDSTLPCNVIQEFKTLLLSLNKMGTIQVPRYVACNDMASIKLVGFADASFKGFGCCLYLRTLRKDGTVKMELLCAKSRVSPLRRSLTIPQLELNSALLLAKLADRVKETLQSRFPNIMTILHSDSQIALYWISSNNKKISPYVSNRVKQIQNLTQKCMWSYIRTAENPADILSRGVAPEKLAEVSLWWNGPQGQLNREYHYQSFQAASVINKLFNPDLESHDDNIDPIVQLPSNFCEIEPGFNIFDRYSDFNKLQIQIAYILRFKNNTKKNNDKVIGPMSPQEYSEAMKVITKYIQSTSFSQEILSITNDKPIKSSMGSLHPFMDSDGILRVGGRLQNATNLSYDKMHPIILPKSNRLTHLLILKEHNRLLHAGTKLVLSSLSQRYWIISGLREVKKVLHSCLKCFRIKAEGAKQLMGSLPSQRVTANRPFQVVGVDFCGPFNLKIARIRRPIITKAYIAVYVCFSTKAIHMEVVSNLTSDAFLACLKRFVSRRGVPNLICCDNAKTFKGADNQLKELYKLLSSDSHRDSVNKFCLINNLKFKYIPSYSPEFGGLWEAGVKSFKYHFKRIVGDIALTYEELYTVITQIEAVLNSRPLCPLTSDISDLNYLSPGHFLIGTQLMSLPEINFTEVKNINRLNFWNMCTKIKQDFWNVWHKDYLTVLQNRTKWRKDVVNLKVGDLVIVKMSNLTPMMWPMGRIVKVVPGPDGKVRVADVKMSDKVYTRSYKTLCPLPFLENV